MNLHKAQIRVTPSNDKPLDLPGLVRLLEDEAGFAPITDAEISLRGRVAKRSERLALEVSKTGQTSISARRLKARSRPRDSPSKRGGRWRMSTKGSS